MDLMEWIIVYKYTQKGVFSSSSSTNIHIAPSPYFFYVNVFLVFYFIFFLFFIYSVLCVHFVNVLLICVLSFWDWIIFSLTLSIFSQHTILYTLYYNMACLYSKMCEMIKKVLVATLFTEDCFFSSSLRNKNRLFIQQKIIWQASDDIRTRFPITPKKKIPFIFHKKIKIKLWWKNSMWDDDKRSKQVKVKYYL